MAQRLVTPHGLAAATAADEQTEQLGMDVGVEGLETRQPPQHGDGRIEVARLGLERYASAFERHAAVQCGFCTPGFLLTLKSLSDAGELSSEEEIRHGLDGNLCRCTGYRAILEAARDIGEVAA